MLFIISHKSFFDLINISKTKYFASTLIIYEINHIVLIVILFKSNLPCAVKSRISFLSILSLKAYKQKIFTIFKNLQ